MVVAALAVAAALAAATVTGAITGAKVASSGTGGSGPVVFLQFNACGNACGHEMAVVDDIERSVAGHDPQPLVITLQEICRSQYSKLSTDLRPYYGRFEATITHRCWDGSDYGIGILVRTTAYTFVKTWSLPNPGNDEPRKLVCLELPVAGVTRALLACSTHLDHHRENSGPQAGYLGEVLRSYWGAHPIMVGGDFNLEPLDDGLDDVYHRGYRDRAGRGIFEEADSSTLVRRHDVVPGDVHNEDTICADDPCLALSHPSLHKYDYVFLSRDDFTGYRADVTSAPHSDHAPLWATVTVK